MKKTILSAAALLVMSGAAMAQSSLTLYGLVDLSLESVKLNGKTVTRVTSDNYASSRLGFRGTEDLGGGLKANFVLESGLKPDTGAAGSGSTFWSRSAWVGLSGGFGDLRLGRIDSTIGAMAGNTAILGGQDYDDFKIANTFAGVDYRRVNNAITYSLPKLLDGLSAQVQYFTDADGQEDATDKTGRGYGLGAQYAAGPFAAGAAYIEVERNATGSAEDSAALAYVSYDFGVAKAIGYYNVDSTRVGEANRTEIIGLKAVVPYSSAFSVSFGVSQVRDAEGLTGDDDALIIAVKGNYALSKRTAVYGILTSIDNDNLARRQIGGGASTVAGKNSHGLAIGIRHAF